MQRRLPLLAVAAVGGLVILSSCSSVDKPAATVNGYEISMDSFEAVALGDPGRQPDPAAAPDDTTPAPNAARADGEAARGGLTGQILAQLFNEAASEGGRPVTDADRAAVSESLADEQLSPAYKALVVEFQAAQNALLELGAPNAQQIYESGIATSGVACVSHILVETETAANDVVKQLADGADFGELAATASTDSGSAATGGSLGECTAAQQFQQQFIPEFVAGALAATPGEPTGPIKSEFGYHIILVRPWADVAAEATRIIGQAGVQEQVQKVLADAEISVDPSIGRWSMTQNAVVALDAAEPDSIPVG